MTFKIALIGDIHSFWNAFDTDYFNRSDYDYLLFTGDLPRIIGGEKDAKLLAELNKPGIVMMGNHDAATIPQFLAELKNYPLLAKITSFGQTRRVGKIEKALGHLQLGGYKLHPLPALGSDYACITARPHAMGGDRLYFKSYLKQRFNVQSIEDSQKLLCELVDRATLNIIFLAHNGPAGLGSGATDIWGCDFNPALGDFGDADLKYAIAYAKQQGKNVIAVVAGHMHHHLKGASAGIITARNWQQIKDDVVYLNAARVPRIFRKDEKILHHHIALYISKNISNKVTFEEVLVTE